MDFPRRLRCPGSRERTTQTLAWSGLANRLPAAASDLRRRGDTVFRALEPDVLRIEDDRIAEITPFGHSQFPAFGLAGTLA